MFAPFRIVLATTRPASSAETEGPVSVDRTAEPIVATEADFPIHLLPDAGVEGVSQAPGRKSGWLVPAWEGDGYLWYPFAPPPRTGSECSPPRKDLESSTARQLAFGIVHLRLSYRIEDTVYQTLVRFRVTPSVSLEPIWVAMERDLGHDAQELLWQWRYGKVTPERRRIADPIRGSGVLAASVTSAIESAKPSLDRLLASARARGSLDHRLATPHRAGAFERRPFEDRFVCGAVASWGMSLRQCGQTFNSARSGLRAEIASQAPQRNIKGYKDAQDSELVRLDDCSRICMSLTRALEKWLLAYSGRRHVPELRFRWTPRLVHSPEYRPILDADRKLRALIRGQSAQVPPGIWVRQLSFLFEAWAFEAIAALITLDGWLREDDELEETRPRRNFLPLDHYRAKGSRIVFRRRDAVLTMIFNPLATPRTPKNTPRAARRLTVLEKDYNQMTAGWYTVDGGLEPDYALHVETNDGSAVALGDAICQRVPDDKIFWKDDSGGARNEADRREPTVAPVYGKATKIRATYSDAMWFVPRLGFPLIPIAELGFTVFLGTPKAADKLERSERAVGHLLPLIPDPKRPVADGLAANDYRLGRLKVLVDCLEKHARGIGRLASEPAVSETK